MNKSYWTTGIFIVLLFGRMELYGVENWRQLPVKIKELKSFAYLYSSQKVPGTGELADKNGMYEIPDFHKKVSAEILTDGRVAGGSSLGTHFWSNQLKTVEIIVDAEKDFFIDHVEIWQSDITEATHIEEVKIFTELQPGLWSSPLVFKDLYNSNKTENPISLKTEKETAQIKIICATRAACMKISEIKVFGSAADSNAASQKIMVVPEGSLRLEMEKIYGGYESNSPNYLNDKAIYPTSHDFDLGLPESLKYSFWLRSKGEFDIAVNGKKHRLDESRLGWTKVPGSFSGKTQITIQSAMPGNSLIDSLIFIPEETFDPNEIPDMAYFMKIPEIQPLPRFAAKLLQDNPRISSAEFGKKVAGHYGYKERKPGRCVDENNSILVNGQPLFSTLFFHVDLKDPRLEELAITSGFGVPSDSNADYLSKMKRTTITSFNRRWKAYDAVAAERQGKQDNPFVALHYLVDEPENADVSAHELELLHSLVKAIDPDKPTFVNVSATSPLKAALKVTDVVGVDHYPIPNGRIGDTGFIMDSIRYYSENRPVIFLAQAFSWNEKDPAKYRLPTPEEFSAQCLTALVHGAKGLWLYNFPAPRHGAKTCIKDVDINLWNRIRKMLETVKEISSGLLGPETSPDWKIISAEKRQRAEFRLAISADKSKAWLLAVNPWDKKQDAMIDIKDSVLRNAELLPCADFGAKISKEPDGKYKFIFDRLSGGVYEVRSSGLQQVKTLTTAEGFAKIKESFEKGTDKPNAEIPFVENWDNDWRKATDLLDNWCSSARPDSAKMIADSKGIHLKMTVRIPVNAKAKCTERDSNVWTDPCLEVFIGRPGSLKYAQLIVNLLNVQADIEFDQARDKAHDVSVNYQWDSKVDVNVELADYEIFIPWVEVCRITGSKPGDKMTFNVAFGASKTDWAGLSGTGYHALDKFGILTFKKE